jgi:hypothetical protein
MADGATFGATAGQDRRYLGTSASAAGDLALSTRVGGNTVLTGRQHSADRSVAGFSKLLREEIQTRLMHIVKKLTHVDAAQLT